MKRVLTGVKRTQTRHHNIHVSLMAGLPDLYRKRTLLLNRLILLYAKKETEGEFLRNISIAELNKARQETFRELAIVDSGIEKIIEKVRANHSKYMEKLNELRDQIKH